MDDQVTILFGGDCHFGDKPVRLDRGLGERIAQAAFLVVNQESPVTGIESPAAQKAIYLRSSTRAINSLQDLRVKVASLANNHIADYGEEGLEETISRLRSAGITPVGAGANLSEASSPAYVGLPDGQTLAFLAFTSKDIGSKIAEERGYGCAELEPVAIERAIRRAREKASHVVLLLHYGLTNFDYPTPKQRDVMRSFAGRGVDLIIGHHPHVVQGYEIVDGVPVFYSLGNLIFASYRKFGRAVSLSAEARSGALVAVAFSPRGVRIKDVIFTETRETSDHLVFGVPQASVAPARRFEARSRRLACSCYETFFRRYAIRRIFVACWFGPRRGGGGRSAARSSAVFFSRCRTLLVESDK